MERSLFSVKGEPVAYISDDYHHTIYLWDGYPVACLYQDSHIYGMNGRHLGWFLGDILYEHHGRRIGFTNQTCPGALWKEPMKAEKRPRDELRAKWKAPPMPKLRFDFADQDLRSFLKQGQIEWLTEGPSGAVL